MLTRTKIQLFFAFLVAAISVKAQFHVTVNASSSGTGTLDDPIDLQTILKSGATVQAGDTIFIHEGVYKGSFVTYVTGKEGKPVVICPYKNDLVVFDNHAEGLESLYRTQLNVNQSYVQLKGLVFTNSNKDNRASQDIHDGYGGRPNDIPSGDGIVTHNGNVDIINCIFHNVRGTSIGTYKTGGYIYGNIIFHSGFDNLDRGHGHGMYIQNGDVDNPKYFENNLIHTGFMYNMKLYTTNGFLQGITVRDNICFNSAICSEPGDSKDAGRDIFLGGKEPAQYVTIENNYTYKSEWGITINGPSLQIGWRDLCRHITVTDNYVVGGNRTFTVINTDNSEFTRNVFVSRDKPDLKVAPYFRDYVLRYDSISTGSPSGMLFDHNSYFTGTNTNQVQIASSSITKDEWQAKHFDANSTFKVGLPEKNVVKVLPNKHEAGRAHIVVYNWENKDHVSIDVSDVVKKGQDYYLYDSQDLFSGALLKGVYSENLNVPMYGSDHDVTQPYGKNIQHIKHTEKEFGAFVLTTRPLYPEQNNETTAADNHHRMLTGTKYWPNPTADFVDINFLTSEKQTSIKVTDLAGKVVLVKKVINEKHMVAHGAYRYRLNLSSIPKGVYIVQLKDGVGCESFRIIKRQ